MFLDIYEFEGMGDIMHKYINNNTYEIINNVFEVDDLMG